jgi:Protein of unknown function (DUF2905)
LIGITLVPVLSARELGRALLVASALLAVIGALLRFSGRLPFRIGRLPGDIVDRSAHATFYFPITTCILFSAALTILLWLVSRFRR